MSTLTPLPSAGVPPGFDPIFRTSPVLDALGHFYSRGAGTALEIGLLVDARHVNSRGSLHGGVIATLADTGMGYLLAFATEPPRRLVTVNLSVDFLAPASVGDWVSIVLDSTDAKGRHVFATASMHVNQSCIARVRGVYAVTNQ